MSGEIIHGRAAEVLEEIITRPGYDPSEVVVITDPPWPNCEHIKIQGSWDAVGVWRPVAALMPRVASRLVVWLGHNSDPRDMLGAVPREMKFATTVTLRMVPPGYRGCFMAGDIAHVFGRMRLPKGTRVLPGEIVSNGPEHRHERGLLEHPCPRSPLHARGLVRWYAARAKLIIDPFCGSGTVTVEAARLGIPYIGIDSDLQWVEESRARHARIERQQLLDFELSIERQQLLDFELSIERQQLLDFELRTEQLEIGHDVPRGTS